MLSPPVLVGSAVSGASSALSGASAEFADAFAPALAPTSLPRACAECSVRRERPPRVGTEEGAGSSILSPLKGLQFALSNAYEQAQERREARVASAEELKLLVFVYRMVDACLERRYRAELTAAREAPAS
ncbi:hypothetical protein HYPSUDRAFT_199262 [Hypholoma sublateritium FD-334 SS-4]|uniref:Uncharacterized protein n=1 Tax=Hypholoma sublateritium (strain FD-334 SS-4) TaxID=945553 RepID=A0A0D2Q386_HYPSF|nr:hypothetical protein HYPSUDRAFT_199262 [Hypholoma sublateritium FD-334 SS-4]